MVSWTSRPSWSDSRAFNTGHGRLSPRVNHAPGGTLVVGRFPIAPHWTTLKSRRRLGPSINLNGVALFYANSCYQIYAQVHPFHWHMWLSFGFCATRNHYSEMRLVAGDYLPCAVQGYDSCSLIQLFGSPQFKSGEVRPASGRCCTSRVLMMDTHIE